MNEKTFERKVEIKDKIIKRQIVEIDRLKKNVSTLEVSCEKKEKLINSFETLRTEMENTVNGLKEKENEYDVLIEDLKKMRSVMNKTVFKGRWRLIKLLLK